LDFFSGMATFIPGLHHSRGKVPEF